MPAYCANCNREAPCVSTVGLNEAGWVFGDRWPGRWICDVCYGARQHNKPMPITLHDDGTIERMDEPGDEPHIPTGKPASKLAREIAARVWCDQEMRQIAMDVDAAEAIARIIDGVRHAQADKQSYDDLAASGGIVGAP